MNKKPVFFNSAVMFMGLAFVIGLTGPAFAKQPEDVPYMAEILNRLETLQNTVDNLSTEVDLRGVTQNWDKKLDATNGDANGCNSDRFTCLFGDTAVRDNETGVVWDRSPSSSMGSWAIAMDNCSNRAVGERKGWSLPMQEQLATLVDTSNSDPSLPTGHPFLTVQSGSYWSATTNTFFSSSAKAVDFFNGTVGNAVKISVGLHTWCVRGGQSYDGQDVNNVINLLP